ncbi:MAG: Wadjet anti-phage system protein JetD domain-containing protein [Cyanobacteria bacterium P01_D01_bin.1]
MISPEQIKKKAQRQYKDFLRATITGECFFPIDVPVGRPPKAYPDLHKAITELIDGSKSKQGFGYELVLETKNTHKYGLQSLPQQISIESESDYLKLIEQEQTFADFKADVALIQSSVPALSEWVQYYPLKVIANHGHWPDLLKVCHYFQQNPKPNLYIRELPIAVHTKFIEENKGILRSLLEQVLPAASSDSEEGKKLTFEQQFFLRYSEPLIRCRLLDPVLQQQYGFPFADFSLAISDFRQLGIGAPDCFITENLMPFLTLPAITNGIAIWGSGYAVSRLKSVNWLKRCPIFYWGDLDVDGFNILAQLRSHFPQTQSILMDTATYEAFADFAVIDEKPIAIAPTLLTPAEASLYAYLSTEQKRLEQERISQTYVNHFLHRLSKQPQGQS